MSSTAESLCSMPGTDVPPYVSYASRQKKARDSRRALGSLQPEARMCLVHKNLPSQGERAHLRDPTRPQSHPVTKPASQAPGTWQATSASTISCLQKCVSFFPTHPRGAHPASRGTNQTPDLSCEQDRRESAHCTRTQGPSSRATVNSMLKS